jgi:hypothetical protein
MDTVEKDTRYRQILQQIVLAHANEPRRPELVSLLPICDTAHDSYLLMRVGFDRVGRAHHILFHFRLKDGKVLIEHDGIEYGIARDLLAAGVAPDDIVFNMYRTPRPLTEALAA